MADRPRMTADQLVDKLLASEHADVLRESIAWLVAELMDAEVATLVGAELGERAPDRRTTQRNGYRPQDLGHPGRLDRAGHPQAALWQLLPLVPGAPPARRAGPGRGRAGGLRQRRLHRQGRPAGRPARPAGHDQRPGLPAVRWPGRAGPSVPGAAPGGRLPVSVAGRQGRAGPRAGRGQAQGTGDRRRRPPQRPPRGARPGRRPGRDRGVLARVPQVLAGPWPGRRQARHHRRARRLKQAIAQVLGCSWQRCTVHFLRDTLGHVTRAQQPLVSGAIRGSFTAATAAEARQRLGRVVDQLRVHTPKVAGLLETPRPTCWPSPGSRPSLGPSCAPPTPWSGSTARSAGARMWWGSSPTTPRCCAWPGCCCSSRTMSGWSGAATCRRPPWPWWWPPTTQTRPPRPAARRWPSSPRPEQTSHADDHQLHHQMRLG
jgi:Transposase, Mutator family